MPSGQDGDDQPDDPTTHASGARAWLIVLLVGLVVFAIVALACRAFFEQSEQQLLQERTEEASAVLGVSVSQIRVPLDAAATLARITEGDPATFASALESDVGPEGQFTSAILFEIGSNDPVSSIGEPSELASQDSEVAALVALAATEPFVVVDLLADGRRLGYAVVDDPEQPEYVVYGERQLSLDPNVRRRTDQPFADLDYAIYLGDQPVADELLGASVRQLPLDGRTASASSEFGDQQLLLVMSPTRQLSSGVFANLWWIVALFGLALSCVAAWLTRSLYRRREQAITLAADNARLYGEQRQIAETLQLGLLPQRLVPPPGGRVTARYWPAGTASLIGGDFYDAFQVDERRWGVAIGDMCGKGIEAAAITGLVRHTLRAAARSAESPSAVLRSVHEALGDHRPATFCTVCFMYVVVDDDGSQHLDVALGGHPQPLLRRAGGGVEQIGRPGTLLGMLEPNLTDVRVDVVSGDTLVLYTDGLTDAPHDQAVPIQELVDLIDGEGDTPVDQLADSIRPLKRRRRPHGSSDDTALLLVRFGTTLPAAAKPADDLLESAPESVAQADLA